MCVYYVYVCRPQYSLSLKECERLQARVKELQQQLTKEKEDAEKMRGVIYDLIVVYHLIYPITMVHKRVV